MGYYIYYVSNFPFAEMVFSVLESRIAWGFVCAPSDRIRFSIILLVVLLRLQTYGYLEKILLLN